MCTKKLTIVYLAVLISLTMSLIFPAGVLADDTQPPAPDAPEVATPPEGTSTEEDPAEETTTPESTDEAPSQEDETAATDSSASDAIPDETEDETAGPDPSASGAMPDETADEATDPSASDAMSDEEAVDTGSDIPLLDQLPEGTDVVVLDEEGQVVPLASQEAAEILALPDPQFCPTGFLPGADECEDVRTTIQAAVNDAKAAGISGTVYIQSGTFNEIVTIADFAYALTLQGVFNLAPYTALTDPANRPVINGRILIQDGTDSGTTGNTANITLIDLIINNSDTTTGDDAAIFADQNTADLTLINLDINAATNSNGGLMIQNHTGNVFLTGVDASGTDEYGASINNTAGSGNVTVTGSVFSGNDTDGLRIYSDGNVDLDNVTADTNTGNGVYIENQTSATNADVTLTGTNSLVGNTYNGLYVRSKGDITLSNITANGSVNDSGVWLDNDETGAIGGVTFNGTNNVFSGNNDYGLVIDSRGAISLANIIANGNKTEDGVNIENCNWSGSACLGSGDVVLSGVLQFINNGNDGNDDGLTISSGGNVTMSNVTATDNKDEGVEINNTGSSASAIVQVLGTNIFTGNTGDGLNIRSDGNIALNNITADANRDNGIDIDNTSSNTNATFTVTGTNSFSNNVNTGMNVLTEGAITLANIVASGNTAGTGAYLVNDYTGAGGVTITGTNIFNTNYNSGLVIDARSAVSLENVTARDNIRGDGVNIDNCGWGGGTLGCLGGGNVTLIGASVFTNNGNGGDRGLYVNSNGNVSMADVTATNNKGNGVEINNTSNTTSTTTATVQIGGTNVFTGNIGNGLAIYSKGNVDLNNVTAGANTIEGIHIENQTGTTTASVTFTGLNNLGGNTSNGVSVRSKGAITLSNVIANGSTADSGAYLRNDYTGAVGGVTLTGSNSFSGNNDYGLQILSLGAVSLNNVTADNNVLEYGAYISNAGTGASGDVTVTGANNSFSGNDDYGLGIVSRGAVSLENVAANGNKTADGVNIDNAAGTGNVTFTGTQTFMNNGNGDGDDGLYIRSQGNVSLADVIATGNKDEGVEIDNTPSSTRALVSIGGTNLFSDNIGNGLVISSDGAINLNNVTSSNSVNDSGAWLNNNQSGADSSSSVTLTGTNIFSNNNDYGLQINSKGAISVNDITTIGNKNDSGVWLDNDEAGAVGGVTFTGPNNIFNGNRDWGLWVDSRGTVSFENITANSNQLEDGVYIDNADGTGSATLTGILTFTNNGNDNNDDGLYIRTQSNLTLENLTATGNKDDGVEIDNTPGTGGSVAVTGGIYNQNTGDGLYIRSDGLITLENVIANQNGDDGGDISNDTGGSVAGANVFVLNSTFNSNMDDGLVAASNLDVVLMNVTAQNNDNDGVELYSDGDNVVLCGGVFSGNDIQAGSTDFNVRVTGGTRTRSNDIVVTNWSPSTGWTGVPSGTGRCANTDNDVFPNNWDTDDDNDGVLDVDDAFPLDPTESVDTDGDGTGNNADLDDDGDGVPDINDAFPLDPAESTDTDGDGIGNNADTDDDNDGMADLSDACPIGASTGTDTDGDGCKDAGEDNDDDGDNVLDTGDSCPVGVATGTDTDGDGCKDAGEDADDDGDGVLDVNDACLLGASVGADTDGDGCKNTEDDDDDGDGVLDVDDAFPLNPGESTDADNDGIGDNADLDDDNDGLSDLTEIHLAKVDERQPNGAPGTSFFIPVTGAQGIALSCTDLASALELEGVKVLFDKLCGYSAELGEVSENELPGALPDGNKFVDGVGISLLQNGSPVDMLPTGTNVTLSFEVPSNLMGKSLVILYWNPATKTWVEKSANVAEGKVTLATAMPGIFVLVAK